MALVARLAKITVKKRLSGAWRPHTHTLDQYIRVLDVRARSKEGLVGQYFQHHDGATVDSGQHASHAVLSGSGSRLVSTGARCA